MAPLRIVVVAPYFSGGKFGGGELWAREVALGLRARGHHVEVVSTNLTRHQSCFEPKAKARGEAWGLPVRRHRVSLLLGALAAVRGFYPFAPGILLDRAIARADVVLVSGIEDPTAMLAVLAARLRGKVCVVNPHTHMDLVRRAGIDRRALWAVVESCGPFFVFNTAAEQPFWRARLPEQQVLGAVGCGVPPLPPGADEDRAAARGALGLPEDEGLVLFLGRLHWNKGVLRAIEACEGLDGPRLHLAGFVEDHPAWLRGERVTLRDFAARRWPQGRFRWVGEVDERAKHRWLSACDVLVLPSFNESFGIVFLEAWQHGKPVVGWDAGGMPQVIRDGTDGFVVGSVKELRERLASLVRDPALAARMGEAGRAKVRAGYGWPDVAARVEADLALAIERHRAAQGPRTSEELRGFAD